MPWKSTTGIRDMTSEYETMRADEARQWMAERKQDEYTLLDVRQPWEYEKTHLPGAVLIPLADLDERTHELDTSDPLMAYCRSGARSASAAGMLSGRGFPLVVNMAGGITAWNGAAAVGPPQAGLTHFKGDESPREVIILACVMEDNLGAFYKATAERMPDTEAADAMRRLAGFEEKHKAWLLAVYRQQYKDVLTEAEIDADLAPDALEGGLTADEFLEANQPVLDDPRSVIETGMMFEAQAMDMYMRLSRKAQDEDAAALLVKLSQEEKGHLKALATLLDRIGQD